MQERLTELEVKVAFLENYATQLDEVLQEAVARIEMLTKEVGELRESRAAFSIRGDLNEERPPHHDKI